ncbi:MULTISPECIES: DUF6482 family protein [Vibrio]|uniref:Uncharacterized protein n=2 Tax=Vibrio TaxID=662 RepID=A0A7X4LMT1_9VIBR|nr:MULTISPECIES: DUF6482 family protein [Vibrio]MBF8999214.1 hypothetical protein [Vibrio nitrifigilis]MZI94646.1 hypothetical protein [Vibrio eleionomae]
MEKAQFNQWLRNQQNEDQPKVFIMGCADARQYSILVEHKHHLEPLRDRDVTLHFSSLDEAKLQLMKFGLKSAYLRLSTPYEECGIPGDNKYSDIPLPLYS